MEDCPNVPHRACGVWNERDASPCLLLLQHILWRGLDPFNRGTPFVTAMPGSGPSGGLCGELGFQLSEEIHSLLFHGRGLDVVGRWGAGLRVLVLEQSSGALPGQGVSARGLEGLLLGAEVSTWLLKTS